MGYYSGNGVVTGGSKTTQNGGFSLPHSGYARIITTATTVVKKYNGVSLSTAQSKTPSNDIKGGYAYESAWSSSGGILYYNDIIVPNYAGDRVDYTYTQINGSNLYELTEASTNLSSSVTTGAGAYVQIQ